MEWEIDIDLRKAARAVAIAGHALTQQSTHPGFWRILGSALVALGSFKEASSALEQGIEQYPASVELHIALAEVMLVQGFYEQAAQPAKRAVELTNGLFAAELVHIRVLAHLNQWEAIYKKQIRRDALLLSTWLVLSREAEVIGPLKTIDLCDSPCFLRNGNAKYLKAMALAQLARREESRDLIELAELVQIEQLPPPYGYKDDECFRNLLAQEIRANPTLSWDPRGRSSRGGRQTRSLRQLNAPATDALLTEIRSAIGAHIHRLSASGNEFLKASPRKARLVSWAVLQGGAGSQRPHRHPDGWLSGVYYVVAPHASEGTFLGALLMGAIDQERYGFEPPWGVWKIEPVPGRLVIFPSYIPHATEPSGVNGERICVAFDVVPVAEAVTCVSST